MKSTKNAAIKKFLTVRECAEKLDIKSSTLHSRLQRDQVPKKFYVQLNQKGSYLISASYLAFVGAKKQKPGVKTGYKFKSRVPKAASESQILDEQVQIESQVFNSDFGI